jgi:hypothetical protein
LEDISELDEEERAEYEALNRQLDQLDKVMVIKVDTSTG